jgi:hypothetical protein
MAGVAVLMGARAAFAQATSAVHGRILGEAGIGLTGAEVSFVVGKRMVRSDSTGRFALDSLSPGKHVLLVRAIGYQPRIVLATVFGHDTASFELTLERATPTLDTVRIRAPRPLFIGYDDFERRRLTTSGTFLTFPYLEQQAGRKLGDVLSTAGTGVHMVSGSHGIGPRVPVITRDPFGATCPMELVLDDKHLRSTDFDIDQIDPRDVAGVEVYRGSAATPEVFGSRNEKCGTLVIWTRMR